MSDRELLELAAKAAGIKASWGIVTNYGPDGEEQIELTDLFFIEGDAHCAVWNPFTDDGDALRLAVKLGLAVIPYPIYAKPKHSVIAKQYDQAKYFRGAGEDVMIEEIEVYGADPCAATRHAIVRAAAEIGRSMP